MKIREMLSSILIILGFYCCTQVFATESIPYKNLKNNHWISYSENSQTWINKCDKKNNVCYKRSILYNDAQGSVYYNKAGDVAFNTNCQYEFIKDGKLIGYSNSDINFYEFLFESDGAINKRQLSLEEVSALFSDYKIIKLSDFSPSTNSIRIRKGKNDLKILVYNDKNAKFDFYDYGTYNAKYTTYPLKGLLKVRRAGMIHFSHYGDNTKNNPLYVILVR